VIAEHGRPVHLHWRYVALVALGGAFGTAGREGLTLAIPSLGTFPLATFTINLTGAFLLGFLLEALTRHGPDDGGRRTIRLFLGTGFLGGFTTYSALATDTVVLIAADDAGLALAYSLGTVIVGAVASWSGIAVAARRRGTAAVSGTVNG
jgi:fluoride exporter